MWQSLPIHICPIETFPSYPSATGAVDMAGNAWEWTMGGYASYPGAHNMVFNDPSREVTRGGSWTNSSYNLRCATRSPQPRDMTDANIGFRVVWSDDYPDNYITPVPVRTSFNQWAEHFTTSTAIDETKLWWGQTPSFTIQTGSPGYLLASLSNSGESMGCYKRTVSGVFSTGDYVDVTVRLKYSYADRSYARSSVALSWTGISGGNGSIEPGGRGADENTGYPWYLIANNSDTPNEWHEVTCKRVKWWDGQICLGFGLWRNLLSTSTNLQMWVDSITIRHSVSDYPFFGYVSPAGTGATVSLFNGYGQLLASAETDSNGYYEIYYPEAAAGGYAVGVSKPGYFWQSRSTSYQEASVQENFTMVPDRPTVVSTVPQSAATGVSRNRVVKATFTKSMDPTTINTNTFIVKDSSNNPISGTVSYNATNYTAEFTPASPLSVGTTYTATVTTGVASIYGINMASNYIWSFTTTNGNQAKIKVKWDAPGPTHDGSSWNNAFLTIADGLNAAQAEDELWVAAGTYAESITLKDDVSVYGGFNGYETDRSQKNPYAYATTIHWEQTCAVLAPVEVSRYTVFDGFTVSSAGIHDTGSGVRCDGTPVISNNTITGWSGLYHGGAVYINDRGGEGPIIEKNIITGNSCPAICVWDGPVEIVGNHIVDNSNSGIFITSDDPDVEIVNNIIEGNGGEWVWGAGICCNYGSSPTITNNTIVSNYSGDYGGGGICVENGASATITNNIIAFNTAVDGGGGVHSDSANTAMDYNDVYGNTSQSQYDDYYGVAPGTYDISVDPGFYDADSGDYHLAYGSYCIDAGLDTASAIPAYDKDGRARILGSAVDMGAYEYRCLHVSTSGSDSNDGSSWAQAKASIYTTSQAALEGDEIWVAAGTYTENPIELKNGMKLLGGFLGSGTTRDWNTYTTTILAGYATWTTAKCTHSTVLEGFTITGTGYYLGGGCINAGSPTITHNVFANCRVSYGGGAIIVNSGSPRIINNVFTGNSAYQGGAIFAGSGSPVIVNNTFMGNSATMGGAIYIYASASPVISNNIIYNSTGYGIYNNGGNPTVTYNCLYGNSPDHYYGVSSSSGDVVADPLFASGWRLAYNSPCIDAGGSAAVLPVIDMDGDARPYNGTIDIGADEWAQ